MDIYDPALLDDTRNYTAMHYEVSKFFGNTSTSGFDIDLTPSDSVKKMPMPIGSRVRITNFDLISMKKIIRPANTTNNIATILKFTNKLPKHILE